MKKFILLFIMASTFGIKSQTCSALFSFSSYFDKVTFYNQSVASNARYYWTFGDGTSSNYKTPFHTYCTNGTYNITLYVQDTITHCTSFYDQTIYVVQQSTNSCAVVSISDSIWNVTPDQGFIKIKETNENCAGYNKYFILNSGANNGQTFLRTTKYPYNFLGGVGYYNGIDQVFATVSLKKNFNKAKNYTPCSANFEYKVVSESNAGQYILFTAMNKNAASYEWYFTGWGDPIVRNTDTALIFYDGTPKCNGWYNARAYIALTTIDVNGCKDTLAQSIANRPMNVTVVGLEENETDNLKLDVYPNPVQQQLKLKYAQGLLNVKSIAITDGLGRTVYREESGYIHGEREIDINALSSGVYFLAVSTANSKKIFKFLKE